MNLREVLRVNDSHSVVALLLHGFVTHYCIVSLNESSCLNCSDNARQSVIDNNVFYTLNSISNMAGFIF